MNVSISDNNQNFQELLSYCRQVLGGHSRLASQRELSEALNVAPTMAGRYISGETDFYNLRAVTVELLAKAAGIDVGTVFVWIASGKAAAMQHEELVTREPVAFSPLEHCRKAVELLEQQQVMAGEGDCADPLPPVDFPGLQLALQSRRGQEGTAVASLFDTLVRSIGAADALARAEAAQPLEGDDWFKLGQLLGMSERELQRCFGPDRIDARSGLPPA